MVSLKTFPPKNFSQPEVVDPSSKLLESTEKSQWRWTSFTGADCFSSFFFLLFFLGMVVWKRGWGFWQLVFFFWVGCLCFFGWLVWRELLSWNKDRECRLFFCVWKERCMKMVITTFANVLSVAYLSPEQQRIAHIRRCFLWFPPRWRLLSLWNLWCLKEDVFLQIFVDSLRQPGPTSNWGSWNGFLISFQSSVHGLWGLSSKNGYAKIGLFFGKPGNLGQQIWPSCLAWNWILPRCCCSSFAGGLGRDKDWHGLFNLQGGPLVAIKWIIIIPVSRVATPVTYL